MILQIVTRERWEQARQAGYCRTESLESEGFIHCSTPSQVVAVANRVFAGQPGLVLLCIEPDRVQPEIRYEGKPGGEQYPHIYGPLNCDAVLEAVAFEPRADGTFALPPELDHAG